MPENSLKAAIAGNLAEQEPAPRPKKKRIQAASETKPARAKKPSRANTVLVGGHFPPAVLKQLRIIAAEEDTTNQALIAEALDLLFIKKGRTKIETL